MSRVIAGALGLDPTRGGGVGSPRGMEGRGGAKSEKQAGAGRAGVGIKAEGTNAQTHGRQKIEEAGKGPGRLSLALVLRPQASVTSDALSMPLPPISKLEVIYISSDSDDEPYRQRKKQKKKRTRNLFLCVRDSEVAPRQNLSLYHQTRIQHF